MGLYVRQDENRSKLQEKIAADLRAKAAEKAKQDIQGPEFDGEKDASVLEDTRTGSPLMGVWLAIIVFAVAAAIFLIVYANGN